MDLVGFDYTNGSGDLRIKPGMLPKDLQDRLAAQLAALAAAGRLPAGYQLAAPTDSKTQTFAVGPLLAYRHFQGATIFFRPPFAGAIHEVATPKVPATDLIAKASSPNWRRRTRRPTRRDSSASAAGLN